MCPYIKNKNVFVSVFIGIVQFLLSEPMAMLLFILLSRKTKDYLYCQFLIPLELLCIVQKLAYTSTHSLMKEYYWYTKLQTFKWSFRREGFDEMPKMV